MLMPTLPHSFARSPKRNVYSPRPAPSSKDATDPHQMDNWFSASKEEQLRLLEQRRRTELLEGLPNHTSPETIFHDHVLHHALDCFSLIMFSPRVDAHRNYWHFQDRRTNEIIPWTSVEDLI